MNVGYDKPLYVLPTRRALPPNPNNAIKERQGVRPPLPGFAGGVRVRQGSIRRSDL